MVGTPVPSSPAPEARVSNIDRSANTRKKIAKAAVEQFYANGYVRTTVAEIVSAAGVTKGAFYHHFRSKSDVLATVQSERLSHQVARFEDAIGAHDSGTDQLRSLIAMIIQYAVEERAALMVWSRDGGHLDADQRARIFALRNRLEAILAEVVSDGANRGEFNSPTHPKLVAFGIIGLCNWVQEWYRADGPLNLTEVSDFYADLVIHGLGGDTRDRSSPGTS